MTGEAVSPYSESGMDQYVYTFQRTNFSTCRFTLKSARMLDSFRQYLADYSVSQAGVLGENRMTVVLEDQSFAETAGGVGPSYQLLPDLIPGPFCRSMSAGICHLLADDRKPAYGICHPSGNRHFRDKSIFDLLFRTDDHMPLRQYPGAG